MTNIVYNRNGVPFDIDNIATDLNGKADCDLTNVNATGTSKVANWGMPSNVYENLVLGASGTSYTAPANGYVQFMSTNTAGPNCYYYLSNDTAHLIAFSEVTTNGVIANLYVPVAKGDSFSAAWFGSGVPSELLFIYAKGEQ